MNQYPATEKENINSRSSKKTSVYDVYGEYKDSGGWRVESVRKSHTLFFLTNETIKRGSGHWGYKSGSN